MTDLVVTSLDHNPGEDILAYQQSHIHAVTDWIQPTGTAPIADRYATRSGSGFENMDVATVEQGIFAASNYGTSSLEVTIGPGEMSLGAAVIATDESRTLTLSTQLDSEPIFVGWNGAAPDQIRVGRAGDFGTDWLTTELARVTTDDTGITSVSRTLQPGLSNGRRRDDLSLDQFDEAVTFNNTVDFTANTNHQGNEIQQARVWTYPGTPGWSPLRVPWINTNTHSGADDLQVNLRDQNGDVERYRIPTERVVPVIEDWDTGSAGARWNLNPDHNIVSPGLDGSQYRLQVDGFGDSVSTTSLPNRPQPGDWLRFRWQFESYHNSASLSAAFFQFGGNVDSQDTYELYWGHREGQNEIIELRKRSGGSNVGTIVRFENVSYFNLNQEYRFDIYWPADSSEDWVVELYENGSLRDQGIISSNDYQYGQGGLRLNNPGGDGGVTWAFDEVVLPPRE